MLMDESLLSIWRDFRYVLRGLRHNMTFTASALIAIAVAIGASTATFSVVDRVLFRDLPYAHDSRLVSVGVTAPIERQEFMLGRQYFDWKDHQRPFEQMTSWSGLSDCDLTDQNPVRLVCARVEGNFLATFGVKPLLGRDFIHNDDVPNAPGVALISYSLWRSRFARDAGILERTISLDGRSVNVVGVLPRDFTLPTLTPADVLVPQQLDEAAQRRSTTGAVLSVFARLKPGLTQPQAASQLQPLLQDFLKFVPPQFRNEVKLKLRSVRDRQFQNARTAAWLLFWALLAFFLIGCATVANLTLARSASREHEFAVRAALGAKRSRLARFALLESFTLALAGGAAGFGLGQVCLRTFSAIVPENFQALQPARLDSRAAMVAFIASLAAAMIFGLPAALRQVRPEMLAGWHSAPRAQTVLRKSLIVGQLAASMVMVCVSGLLMHSLRNIEDDPLGMRTAGVVTAEITLNQNLYRDNIQQMAFFEKLEGRLHAISAINAAAISDSLPPLSTARSTIFASIQVEGQQKFSQGTGGTVVWRAVTPEFFSALSIPITEGRSFREDDRSPDTNVIILGRALARRLFPNESAVGKQLQVNSSPPWFTVVGIAGDVRNNGILGEDEPEYYLLRSHAPDLGLGSRMPPGSLRHAAVIVHTSGPTSLAAQWLAEQIHGLDATVPIDVETMQQRVGMLAQRPKFNAALMSIFAAVSLLLAAVGLYGLLSFLVVQRRREIGVRMALGASRGGIVHLMVGDALRWTVTGIGIGVAGSFLAGRYIRTLLFHVANTDPWSMSTAVLVLLAVAMASAWIPARRASGIDPLIALRSE